MEQTHWVAPLGLKDGWYSSREPVTPPGNSQAPPMVPFPAPPRPTTPLGGSSQSHQVLTTPVAGVKRNVASSPGNTAHTLSPSGTPGLTPIPLSMAYRSHSRSYSYSPQSASTASRHLFKLSLDTTPRPRAYSSGLYDLVEWGPITPPVQRHIPTKGVQPAGIGSPPSSNVWSTTNSDRRQLSDADLGSPPQILALCKDQRGCRFLQRRLSEGDSHVVERIFDSTLGHMIQLMVDPFANYFCQRLVERCTEDQITTIVRQVSPELVSIALNPHGTRALQRLIERLTTDNQVRIVTNALNGSVVRLIRDLNGNHVVQKLLLTIDIPGVQFIYDAVCEAIVEIGGHRHGCCVLQRCLDYALPANKHRLVTRVIEQSYALVGDPYGNYVCQYVLDLGAPEYTNALIDSFLGHIEKLSLQKFSSNVVEKCLKLAEEDQMTRIVGELLQPTTLNRLLLDNYGNYVIQTALENARGDNYTLLRDAVFKALATIRSPYGRCIMAKLR